MNLQSQRTLCIYSSANHHKKNHTKDLTNNNFEDKYHGSVVDANGNISSKYVYVDINLIEAIFNKKNVHNISKIKTVALKTY